MSAFSYVAVDASGRTKRGIIEADTARQARTGLRSAGLVPVEVAPADTEATALGPRRFAWGRRHISGAELALVTRRFAMLLEAGLTVEQCLDALIGQSRNDSMGRTLRTVRAEVLSGHGLAAALERHPSSFPEIYRALVATGEQSGDLGSVMLRLADYLEVRQATRQSAGLALLYPAIVASVALVIVIGLLTYVVPQVVEVFRHSRQELPFLTRALLWMSGTLQSNLLACAIAVGVVAVAVRVALSREVTRAQWQRAMLRLPVVGPLVQGIETARVASTLAILVGSGVPLLQALSAGARVLSSLPLRYAVQDAVRQVREGSSLHRALDSSKLFPVIFIHLIASGETSGRLAHMLSQAARQQETENDGSIRLLTGILEPAVILLMGGIVLLIVLAILQPIMEMNMLIRV